jgi:F-type H+-transporting ATPase subunit delta
LIPKKNIKKYAKLFMRNQTVQEAMVNLEELKTLSETIKTSRELSLFFKSPLFSRKERAMLLSAIQSQEKLSQKIYHFIVYLSNNDALPLLDKIIKAIAELIDEQSRKLKAVVTSAEPLEENFLTQIKSTLETILQTELIIEADIDPSLIGGFKVKAGSIVYDGTVKNQLTTLRDVLLMS